MELIFLRFVVYLSTVISFAHSSETTSNELLNYSEEGWPDTCKGNRQTPINFPDMSKANGTYLPVNNTKIFFNTYKAVTGISMYQVIADAKFAFKQGDMGELFFQKNGFYYKYDLNEIHFHTKSEHRFNGTQYDLEMHMVHSKNNSFFYSANGNQTSDPDSQQQKLVVGILFTLNDNKTNLNSNINNTFIQKLKLWNPTAIVDNFTLNDFVKDNKFFLHYEGSLTTPGCNEFVNWIVMTQLENITSAQLGEFTSFLKSKGYPDGNARKVKELNSRKIYYNDYSTFNAVVLTADGLYLTTKILIVLIGFFVFLLY